MVSSIGTFVLGFVFSLFFFLVFFSFLFFLQGLRVSQVCWSRRGADWLLTCTLLWDQPARTASHIFDVWLRAAASAPWEYVGRAYTVCRGASGFYFLLHPSPNFLPPRFLLQHAYRVVDRPVAVAAGKGALEFCIQPLSEAGLKAELAACSTAQLRWTL